MIRRTVIKTAGAGTITALAGPELVSLARIGTAPIRQTLKTADANFEMLFGVHGREKLGQTLEPPKEDIKIDGMFLETGTYEYIRTQDGAILSPEYLKQFAFYKKLLPYLEENQIPYLLGDMPIEGRNATLGFMGSNIISSITTIVGADMALSSNKTQGLEIGKPTNQITRREAVRRIAGGALGSWGALSFARYPVVAVPELFEQSWTKQVRNAALFAEFIHPEDFIVGFRNAVIAEKLLYHANQLKENGTTHPTIGIAMGNAHGMIQDYLRHGREYCLGFISRYPEGVLKQFFGETYALYLPRLVEINNGPDGKKVARVIVDPELQKKTRNVEHESTSSSERKG